VGRGVLLRGVEVDVLAGVGGVGSRDARLGALSSQTRLHPYAPAGRAEPQRDPVETRVATDLGSLGAEDPAALRQPLAADVAQAGTVTDDQLGDRVEHAVKLSVS
jgi:hypothetical protein